MEWMDEILQANKELEMKEDEELKEKLQAIDTALKENLQENIEKDRLREQRTLEISRQYFLGCTTGWCSSAYTLISSLA